MSSMPGQASKGEKITKQKFHQLDINSLYSKSRGETSEPSTAKLNVPRRHGMQSLGKVPTARRGPVNLPSLKAETSFAAPSEPTTVTATTAPATSTTESVNAVNSVANWTKSEQTEIVFSKTVQVNSSGTVHSQTTVVAQQVNTAAPPPSFHPTNNVHQSQAYQYQQQQSATHHPKYHGTDYSQNNKSWSAITSGSDGQPVLGHVPPPYQSQQFKHEFPSLGRDTAGNVTTATQSQSTNYTNNVEDAQILPNIGQKSGGHATVNDTTQPQYGPVLSLRPQTEGSWTSGGRSGATEGINNVVGNSVQPDTAQAGQQGLPSSFHIIMPQFMQKNNYGSNNFATPPPAITSNFHASFDVSQIVNSVPTGPPTRGGNNSRYTRTSPSTPAVCGPPPAILDELASRPIIKEEDLSRMDDIARDTGWASGGELDYNKKLSFSDDENDDSTSDNKRASIERTPASRYQNTSNRSSVESGASTGRPRPINREEDDTAKHEPDKNKDRSFNRKEDEEDKSVRKMKLLRNYDQRGNERSLKEAVDVKVYHDESGSSANLTTQTLQPAPIPLPEWSSEKSEPTSRHNEISRSNSDKEFATQQPMSDFRALASIETPRSVVRSTTTSSLNTYDRDQTDHYDRGKRSAAAPNASSGPYPRQPPTNLPPRFQKMHQGGHYDAPGQSRWISGQPPGNTRGGGKWDSANTYEDRYRSGNARYRSKDDDKHDDEYKGSDDAYYRKQSTNDDDKSTRDDDKGDSYRSDNDRYRDGPRRYKDDRFVKDDRYTNKDDRYSSKDARYSKDDDRFGYKNDRFSSKNDRSNKKEGYAGKDDWFASKDGKDTFSKKEDRYSKQDDRYPSKEDRYAAKDAKDDKYAAKDDVYSARDDRFSTNEDRYANLKGKTNRYGKDDRYHRGFDEKRHSYSERSDDMRYSESDSNETRSHYDSHASSLNTSRDESRKDHPTTGNTNWADERAPFEDEVAAADVKKSSVTLEDKSEIEMVSDRSTFPNNETAATDTNESSTTTEAISASTVTKLSESVDDTAVKLETLNLATTNKHNETDDTKTQDAAKKRDTRKDDKRGGAPSGRGAEHRTGQSDRYNRAWNQYPGGWPPNNQASTSGSSRERGIRGGQYPKPRYSTRSSRDWPYSESEVSADERLSTDYDSKKRSQTKLMNAIKSEDSRGGKIDEKLDERDEDKSELRGKERSNRYESSRGVNYMPRGEPSRHGRGGSTNYRTASSKLGKRSDNYGPPSNKSTFGSGHYENKDDGASGKEEAAAKSSNEKVDSRSKSSCEGDSNRRRSHSRKNSNRYANPSASGPSNPRKAGNSDWETTSELSDNEHRKAAQQERERERKISVGSNKGSQASSSGPQRQNSGVGFNTAVSKSQPTNNKYSSSRQNSTVQPSQSGGKPGIKKEGSSDKIKEDTASKDRNKQSSERRRDDKSRVERRPERQDYRDGKKDLRKTNSSSSGLSTSSNQGVVERANHAVKQGSESNVNSQSTFGTRQCDASRFKKKAGDNDDSNADSNLVVVGDNQSSEVNQLEAQEVKYSAALLDGSTAPMNTIVFENTNLKTLPSSAVNTVPGNVCENIAMKTKYKNAGKSGDALMNDLNLTKDANTYGKNVEDSADIRLDFATFDEFTTEDKSTGANMSTNKNVVFTTNTQTEELNEKIASVKNVWADANVTPNASLMHQNNQVPVSTQAISENDSSVAYVTTLDAAFSKASGMPQEMQAGGMQSTGAGAQSVGMHSNSEIPVNAQHHHESQTMVQGYPGSPSHQAKVNAVKCSTQPMQQSAYVLQQMNAAVIQASFAAASQQSVTSLMQQGMTQQQGLSPAVTSQSGSTSSSGNPLSPPPTGLPVMNLGPQSYNANPQHINYQANAAQYGSMPPTIASPVPNLVFNNSATAQIAAGQTNNIYGQLHDHHQNHRAASQFSQFSPYGLGQPASNPYNAAAAQSMYLQTAGPPPSNPELYQGISSYRLTTANLGAAQNFATQYGAASQSNNQSTVLISSSSNSLMSASVKPAAPQIAPIGSKVAGGAAYSASAAQQQAAGNIYIPFHPDHSQQLSAASYLQRAAVQNNGVPALSASNTFYSATAGATPGFFQQTNNSTSLQQPNFGLQTNVFGQSPNMNLQNLHNHPYMQHVAYRSYVAQQQHQQHQQQQQQLQQQQVVTCQAQQRPPSLKSPTVATSGSSGVTQQNAQDMLTSVFNTAQPVQPLSPKSRSNAQVQSPSPSLQQQNAFYSGQATQQHYSQQRFPQQPPIQRPQAVAPQGYHLVAQQQRIIQNPTQLMNKYPQQMQQSRATQNKQYYGGISNNYNQYAKKDGDLSVSANGNPTQIVDENEGATDASNQELNE